MAKIRQASMGCLVHTGPSGAPCLVRHLRKLQWLPLTASEREIGLHLFLNLFWWLN
jgi:hypothetical protein